MQEVRDKTGTRISIEQKCSLTLIISSRDSGYFLRSSSHDRRLSVIVMDTVSRSSTSVLLEEYRSIDEQYI